MQGEDFKIRKFFLTIIALITVTTGVFAQSSHNLSVSGKLLDAESKEPVEYVSVVLFSLPDTTLITGVLTNTKGEFVLDKIPMGNYLIKSNSIGYQTLLTTIELKNVSFQFPEPLYMTPSAFSLSNVVVSAERTEKQKSVEKTQINVSQSISQVSGNITDVLKNQSGVSMDAENNIYLRGNKNILILIDGVPTTAATLNAIPSSSVDNVEIITNPDAKYDAEGTGGIINIVTKKQNLQGFSGRVTLNYGLYDKVNGGVNLRYSRGIWSMGFDYSGKYDNNNVYSDLTRELHAQNTFIEQQIKAKQTNISHVAAFNLSATPNKSNLFMFNVKGMFPKFLNKQDIQGKQISLSDTTLFNRKNDITFARKIFEADFTYKKTFEKNKHELSLNTSFSRTKGSRPTKYYVDSELTEKGDGGGTPTNFTLQADYFKSVFKTGKIEGGLKGFIRWNNFNYHFYDLDTVNHWILNPEFSNDLKHNEQIYSAYFMYSGTVFKKLFYKIGARVEYNATNLIQKSNKDTIHNQYWFPFPYLLLKYDINESNVLALTVNRRITRPTYPQLNPIINVIDHFTYETGNKNLAPEVLDKIELNYSFIKEKVQLRTNLFFSTTKNFITQVTLLSPPDKLTITYVNGKRENKMGADIDVNYNICKYISINPILSGFIAQTTGQYNEIDLSAKSLAWTGSLKVLIKPEKYTEIQLFFNYNSPLTLPQFKLDQIYYLDVSVKRSFFKNKFTASLTVTDVFNTYKWNIKSNNSIFNLKNHSKPQTRIFWIGLAYNFNAYKADGKSQRSNNEPDSGIIKLGQ